MQDTNMQQILDRLLEATGVQFAVVANLAAAEIRSVGDPKAVGSSDLFNQLFLDWETVSALNRSLQGQLLPRTWSQGKDCCVVCKPSADVIVGLFCREDRDPIAQYHWSKQMGNEVSALWERAK
jgi:hypothetical protein